jgi:hypothetical protein
VEPRVAPESDPADLAPADVDPVELVPLEVPLLTEMVPGSDLPPHAQMTRTHTIRDALFKDRIGFAAFFL